MYTIEKTICNVVNNHYEYKQLCGQLISAISEKFEYFVQSSRTFVVEDYVENEWRDSYDLYYSKTSYSCVNTVKRVHFISEEIDSYAQISKDNYIGYINLRPIPSANSVLSRIRLKCTGEAFELEGNANSFFCLSTLTTVNFPHISISYKSFPLYSQDSMVAICAHADLLMITKYMYKKFNFNNYKLRDIVNNDNYTFFGQGRKIPSEGLTIYQMVELLRVNNYNPISTLFNNGKSGKIGIIEYIDSFLESALPTILAFDGHVMIIIGHVHNEKKHYIIADDSSYHIKKNFKKRLSHITIVDEEELLSVLSSHQVYLISPSFDRFYLHYPYLKIIIDETKDSLERKCFKNYPQINLTTREILVESCKLKQFLSESGDNSFENVKLPHYVWYVEYYLNNTKKEETLLYYMLVDATAHKLDRIYSTIRNEGGELFRFAKSTMKIKVQQLSLLTDI